MSSKYLIVVAGPTAIGKTETAITLAQHYQTEIISADSRQFYREMSIGTAKPNIAELAAAKHHFIDSHSINADFNVGDFENASLTTLQQIFAEHNIAILAGGSGLYIKAVTEGFDELPPVDANIRQDLNRAFDEYGIQYLQEKLKEADPDYYQEVDLNNPQRIIRALEVYLSTGNAFSSYRKGKKNERPFRTIKIGLNAERALLYNRIDKRVDQMIEQGLLEEVRALAPYRHLNALNTVGYSELFAYLDGLIDLNTAIDRIKQNTRRFAKRQLTWFRRDADIKWFQPDDIANIISYIDNTIAGLNG